MKIIFKYYYDYYKFHKLKPSFIAEISSNHNQDLQRAYKFIDTATKIGCDGVKFQLFKIEELFSPEILETSADHRIRKKWELPLEFIPKLSKKCKENNIKFGITPFFLDAVEFIKPYVDFYKIASYELLWDDLLIACAQTKKSVMISSGMAEMDEILHAVEVLKSNGCKSPKVFHCNSAYPTTCHDTNLAVIETLRKEVNCDIGWSDHSASDAVLLRAIHKWDTKFIEFHLDLDGTGFEFASGHCWLPDQIADVIKKVKDGFLSDGSHIKKPTSSEIGDRDWRADPKDGLRPLKKIRSKWNKNNI